MKPYSLLIHALPTLMLMLAFEPAAAQIPIAVPANPADPTVPHLAYNGRSTICKAISRGTCDTPYFRWDFDGDGQWDLCQGRTLAVANGNWYYDSRYNIDGAYLYPALDPQVAHHRLYNAILEVSCYVYPDGTPRNPHFMSYPVLVDATVPGPESAEVASEDALNIMRLVAVDDALWYMHKQLTRSGYDVSTISGYFSAGGSPSDELTALFASAMLAYGRRGAYPPGTYNSQGYPVPAGFLEENDRLWSVDPYAEDAMRATNFLLSRAGIYAIPAADEEDDGHPALPGTNDLTGYYPGGPGSNEYGRGGVILAALASTGLAGTVVQVGSSPVAGKLMEVVVQQIVDFAIAAQNDGTAGTTMVGGWDFGPCLDCTSGLTYAHMTSYWVLGLETAERRMGASGVYVNQRMKSRLPNAIYYNQHTDGGPRYYTGYTASMFETVGGAILGARWLGWDTWDAGDPTPAGYPYLSITRGQARTCYDRYVAFAANRWNIAGAGGGPIDPDLVLWKDGQPADVTPCYQSDLWTTSAYLLQRGARYTGSTGELQTIGGHDWRHDFTISFIEDQHSSVGTCPPNAYYYDYFEEPGYSFTMPFGPVAATAHVLIMSVMANTPPVAALSAAPCPAGACSGDCCIDNETTVTFQASAFDPDGQVASANLDFGDGSAPVAITSLGQSVEHRYTSAGDFPAILTATDNEGATRSDSLLMSVQAVSFTIVASAGPGGSIDPSGTVVVSAGGSQSFQIAADPGYQIADVVVDGSSVGPVPSYTFSDVRADHTIAASFAGIGACCSSDGICAQAAQTDCDPPSIWVGVGIACEPNPCPNSSVMPIASGSAEGLLGAVPNPFIDGTILWYRIARAERIQLEIFGAGGQRLYSVDLGEQDAGVHSLRWDGRASQGGRVPVGVSFARLSAGSRGWSQALIRVR
jgi:hypothetical protein